MTRALRSNEMYALRMLSTKMKAEEAKQLLLDISDCQVEEATSDGGRLIFVIPGYQRPPYIGQHSYTVGGAIEDADGSEVGVNLYADENHRVLELELIRWNDGPLQKPNWDSFRLLY
jgi:hypothetical protein